jgi:hypothetical protein
VRGSTTEALVECLLDLLSWLVLVRHPAADTPRQTAHAVLSAQHSQHSAHKAGGVDLVEQAEQQIVAVLHRLPNGPLYVLHPPSRPGWCQAIRPFCAPEVRVPWRAKACVYAPLQRVCGMAACERPIRTRVCIVANTDWFLEPCVSC